MWQAAKSVGDRVVACQLGVAMALSGAGPASASDHFDSPAMTANPQADIADVYAWTNPDGRRVNLVMTIVGHSFSDRLRYELHIDSGRAFGRTTSSTTIVCRFPAPKVAACQIGQADAVTGDATNPTGIEGRNHRFRLFAGLRDDPFYNNVKGSLAAYGVEAAAVQAGAPVDTAGCPSLDASAVRAVKDQWAHTDGGPAQNLLANWTASAIVISVDTKIVARGGDVLAVWGSVASPKRQLDRMGRPFVGNTLLGASPFSTDEPSGAERERYNAATPRSASAYVAQIEKSLARHDGLDGKCGNQLLADGHDTSAARYRMLAGVFADDRLWVNSAARTCTQFFAVELASLAHRTALRPDCGGRSPVYETPNVWRSLLVDGTTDSVSDGLHRDERQPSATAFPFLAPPDPHGIDH